MRADVQERLRRKVADKATAAADKAKAAADTAKAASEEASVGARAARHEPESGQPHTPVVTRMVEGAGSVSEVCSDEKRC